MSLEHSLERNDVRSPSRPRFLTQAEAARYLRISVRTLERFRLSGLGCPYAKLGRRVVYEESALIDWARSRMRRSTGGEE